MTASASQLPKIPRRKLRSILNDEEKTALAVDLLYVADTEPGIERKKKGGKFTYFFNNKEIKDDEELLRIKHLVIPPAWERVWICAKKNGHLQATGIDTRNRKQYKYHPTWIAIRNNTKFFRMLDFGKSLPSIRKRLKKDLSATELNVNKVLALVVSLMENTNMAKLIKQCRDIPGKELFQYFDKDGTHHSIDSGMVNNYIHEISDETF